jgi:hypothetical protein
LVLGHFVKDVAKSSDWEPCNPRREQGSRAMGLYERECAAMAA